MPNSSESICVGLRFHWSPLIPKPSTFSNARLELIRSNTICTVTALLETEMLPMVEPFTRIKLDSAAGLVPALAECQNGK